MTEEELDAMVEAEEKRLGVGSKEFIQRHNEIMELIDRARGKGAAADGKADYECPELQTEGFRKTCPGSGSGTERNY